MERGVGARGRWEGRCWRVCGGGGGAAGWGEDGERGCWGEGVEEGFLAEEGFSVCWHGGLDFACYDEVRGF